MKYDSVLEDQGKRGTTMEKDFAREIESRREQIRTVGSQMEQARKDFTLGVTPFVATWIETIARQYIERNPEKALKMGKERLSQLKGKVKLLCSEAESICQEIFSNNDFWPETRELITQNQLGVKLIFGRLGTLLEAFELVKTKAQTEGDEENWTQYDNSDNRREFDGTTVYPHSIELPDGMKKLLEEYRNSFQRKEALQAEILGLELEKLQLQATSLWDSL